MPHLIGDHRRKTARATLLVTAAGEILGTKDLPLRGSGRIVSVLMNLSGS
jgi:hypothetical protein